MRNPARGDVWKVWFYAAGVVALGAWMSPLLYNAGKALAEVSSGKTTNDFLEWLADICREADFPEFYGVAMGLAAMLLFLPWMEWIHARRARAAEGPGPWQLRLPDGAGVAAGGQPLRKNRRGAWHGCAGFLLVAGLLLSMGVVLMPAGLPALRTPDQGIAALAVRTLAWAVVAAVVMEVFFRGIVLGIFLRAMRPAAALGMSAVFFALTLSVIPAAGVSVADPDASGTGFELLGRAAESLVSWRGFFGSLAPLLALGGVLAYARWRTGSLWLPVGLHTGWLFSKGLLAKLSATAGAPLLSGGLFQQGLVPLAAILIAGALAHFLTATPDNETIIRP